MKYKIVRKEYLAGNKIKETFFIQYEYKPWWSRKARWRNCYDLEGRYEYVCRNTLEEAEEYVQILIKSQNLIQEDVKIYECRSSKIDKILTDKTENQ